MWNVWMGAHFHADSCVCINLCQSMHVEVKGQLLSFPPPRGSWGWNSGHRPWGKYLDPPSCLTRPTFNIFKYICLVYLWGGTHVDQGTHDMEGQLDCRSWSFLQVDGFGAQIQLVGLAVSTLIHLLDPTFKGWKNEKRVTAGIYILFSVFILP